MDFAMERRTARLTVVLLLHGNFVFFDDLKRTIQNCGVLQMNDAASRSGFQMPFDDLPSMVFMSPEIISNGLLVHFEFFSDPVDTSGRQGVFDAAQLLEGDIHKPQF